MIYEKIRTSDAKSKMSEILRRVKNGEAFTITNHGKPVADLVPSKTSLKKKVKAAIKNILNAKKVRVSDRVLKKLKGYDCKY